MRFGYRLKASVFHNARISRYARDLASSGKGWCNNRLERRLGLIFGSITVTLNDGTEHVFCSNCNGFCVNVCSAKEKADALAGMAAGLADAGSYDKDSSSFHPRWGLAQGITCSRSLNAAIRCNLMLYLGR